MPSIPQTTTSENLPRGILLVEEYGALAVAIASALRKFAPLHAVQVAHSFAEAETMAARMQPELFVLDLDPPPFGVIAFFNGLKKQYPEARALVIAAGTSRELRTARGTAAALQFIEKPFDLGEFGAAVQALVGPWAGPGSAVRGTIRDLNLLDIAQLECLGLGSTVIRIETPEGRAGEIHFQKGQIIHAAAGTKTGVAALAEIATWSSGEAREVEAPEEGSHTIDTGWTALLLPLAREMTAREKEHSLGASARRPPPAAPTGKKILVIDDTEMLLIFVADVLATADHSFQILTAGTGTEGLRLAADAQPDLILLDYSLADLTGDKICCALLENEATAQIPILMMSGHLTELARTAADYSNVVAALPKPFLSGALINAVAKALEAGPLAKTSPTKPPPKPAPKAVPVAPEPTPASSSESPASLPNGHGPGSDGPPAKAVAASTPTAAETPRKIPEEAAKPPVSVTAPVVRQPDLSVTFSFDVVALELTPFLQTAAVRLEPIGPFVLVQMENHAAFETGFRLARIELGREGAFQSLRLVPTREPIPLPAAVNSFAIGRINLAPSTHHLELKAGRERSMRVQLTAPFSLAEVELSAGFEVATVLLRARSRQVLLRNRGEDPGTIFELGEIELDPAGELRALLVRPVSA